MREAALFPVLKVLSWLVLLLMAVSAGYAYFTVVSHWSSIAV